MRLDFHRKKQMLGVLYGCVCGISFVVFTWGIDALLLMRAHAAYSWLKCIVGLITCLPAAGIVGWMTVRHGSHALALVLWGGLAFMYSLLVVWLPMDGTVEILRELNPTVFFRLEYSEVYHLVQFRIFSFATIGLAAVICGLLEINLVDQALLSTNYSSSVVMVFFCMLLFSLAGSAADHLVNTNFREPMIVLNNAIQFALEHQNKDVPLDVAKKNHFSSVSVIRDIIHEPYSLTIIEYDQLLGQMEILVDFGNTLVRCTTIYAQPTNCIRLTGET